MRVILSFSVAIDDLQYQSLPKFSPKLLEELADDVAGAVSEHEKLMGCDVDAVGKFEAQEGSKRG